MTDDTAPIPPYLEETYWWAYVRPWAMHVWDHEWVVECILLGHYGKLRDIALEELGTGLSGRTLQVGCCYGDLTPHLLERISRSGGMLDVVDVVPAQIEKLRRKIAPDAPLHLQLMDASALTLPDATYDRVLIFMLLHEQPQEYREKTLREALRVLKPGGKIVIIDYARPTWWHPARYTTLVLYRLLKPYAREVWDKGLAAVLPELQNSEWTQCSYFGGLFQKFVGTK